MRPSVLIAESDQELLGIYRQLLKRNGYPVDVARDGLECMSKLCWSIPDVLVLQFEILWGGGAGVLMRMREHAEWSKVPVVVTTTLPAEDLNGLAPRTVILEKPFGFPELAQKIDLVLQRSGRWSQPSCDFRAN